MLKDHRDLGKMQFLLLASASTYTKIGMIQRLAWSLCKEDTDIHEALYIKNKKPKMFSDSVGLGWSLRSCILNKLPGSADALAHSPHFQQQEGRDHTNEWEFATWG